MRPTFWGFPLPNSSAVRYMVAVRIPAMPATMARFPKDSTSCNSPIPAAPMWRDRYTWKEVPTIRSSRFTPVSSSAR